jgi:hypothetical protein
MGNVCAPKERDEGTEDGKKPAKFDELFSEDNSLPHEYDKM